MRRRPWIVTSLLVTVGVQAGCAATGGPSRQPSETEGAAAWPEASEAYETLVAIRDSGAPTKPRDIPPPAGIDASSLAPLPADDPSRSLVEITLEEALAVCITERPETPPAPSAAPTESATVRARSLYASGVGKLLNRDASGAAQDLAAAARLDPAAPAPWLRLAEAQAVLGQAAGAILSYKRAVDLGAEDAIALGLVGLQSDRAGQSDEAAHYLARCLAARPEQRDPLLRNIAYVHLAGPLRQKGYLRASMEASRRGLDMPQRLTAPTRFSDEATAIARRASDLWLEIGDTACRLEDEGAALDAYERAAGLPSLDPSAVLARRTYLLLRIGRGAEAALLLLDDVAQLEGRADARHIALLQMLRVDTRVSALTAQALADLAESLPKPLPASTASALTLARAAAADPSRAHAILAERLAERPRDSTVAEAVFALQEGDRERIDLALDLVEMNPSTADLATGLLLAWHSHPASVPDALPTSRPGELIKLHALRRLGRGADVLASLQQLPEPRNPLAIASLEAVGLAAADQGDWARLEQAIESLTQAEAPRETASLYRAAQRYAEGLQAIRPVLGEDARVADLLRASEMALGADQADEAERLLLRAKEADPFDEGAYEGLLTIYQSQGAEQKATAAVRELRDRVPSGHLLRWVNAQELARRGMLDESERALRELVEEEPQNGNALRLLLQIWQQRARVEDRASLDEAAAWLRGVVEQPPNAPELTAALGRLLLLSGDGDAAREVLVGGMERYNAPIIARSLEEALRQVGEETRANELALARLAGAGRGIDASLEHAELLVRLGRTSEAVDRLRDAMPHGATLTALQRARVLSVATALAAAAEESGQAHDRSLALDAIEAIAAQGIALPWELNLASWSLAAADADLTDQEIVAATERLVQSVTSLESVSPLLESSNAPLPRPIETLEHARGHLAYLLAGQLFAGRPEASLEVFRLALRHDPDHAWAANDLGYFLIERGDLEEAERLLERAYSLLPAEAHITDSLGWLRYKQGLWEDTLLPDGSARAGAVTLLTAATALPDGDDNETVYDHLGDALWRAGRRERAEAMWLRAQQLLFGKLTSQPGSPRRQEWIDLQHVVGDKLDALRAGREPKVAPLFDE